MNYFDIIIAVPLIWGIYKGYKKGFIIEIASLIALGLGIWGGIKFSFISANYLEEVFSISDQLMPLISFVITFIVIVVAVFSLAKIVQRIVKMVALGLINRLAGAIFGVLKFGLIISVILHLVETINSEINFIQPEMKSSSLFYKPVAQLAPILLPELKKLNFSSMVEKVMDESLLPEENSK